MQIHPASIIILLPFKLKSATVIRCEHLACFSHIQLDPVPAVVNGDKELETQVFRKGAFSEAKTEGGCAPQDPGHRVVKLTLLPSSVRSK